MDDRLGWLAALAIVGAVAGCSDSDESDGVGYDDLVDQYDEIRDASRDLPLTDPGTLPQSGGATYDGLMVLSTDGTAGLPSDMAGDMTLRADFNDDSLSGSVDNVITSNEDVLEGSLDISEGEINRGADVSTDYTYAFGMDGTLTEDDGTDLDVNATGAGDFRGSEHEVSTGTIVKGTVSSDEGASLLRGDFVIAR